MNDVLAIDNFSKLKGLPENTTWIQATYQTFGRFTANSYAQQEEGNGKSQLVLNGRANSPANWLIGTNLPSATYSAYTLGFRLIGTPTASQGTASLGVVSNLTQASYDVVLALELTPTGANIHYKDATGPKIQHVAFAYTGGDTYIDWTFRKIVNAPNEMSRFTLTVNNFPAFTGDIFNNAGTSLTVVFAGVIPTEPGDSKGYLRHVTADDRAPTNLGYAITDMYVSKNGKRFGVPNVNSASLATVTGGLHSSDPDVPVEEILQQGPQDWDFAQGLGSVQATFDPVEGEVTQVRAVMQTQGQELLPVQVSAGGSTNTETVYWKPSTVTTITQGTPNEAYLEIGDE